MPLDAHIKAKQIQNTRLGRSLSMSERRRWWLWGWGWWWLCCGAVRNSMLMYEPQSQVSECLSRQSFPHLFISENCQVHFMRKSWMKVREGNEKKILSIGRPFLSPPVIPSSSLSSHPLYLRNAKILRPIGFRLRYRSLSVTRWLERVCVRWACSHPSWAPRCDQNNPFSYSLRFCFKFGSRMWYKFR